MLRPPFCSVVLVNRPKWLILYSNLQLFFLHEIVYSVGV